MSVLGSRNGAEGFDFDIGSIDDSYTILGRDRSATNSLDCTRISPTKILVEGRYPMQLTTESHVVLRFDKASSNIETASLSKATGPYDTHVLSSNILAMLPIDHEFCSYNSKAGQEYFAILSLRALTSLRLFLTDSSNRPLGRIAHSSAKTAAGTGSAQSTLGSLSFRGVLRIDIIQTYIPRPLKTARTTSSVTEEG